MNLDVSNRRSYPGQWFGVLWTGVTALAVAAGTSFGLVAWYFLTALALPFALVLTLLEALDVPVPDWGGERFIPIAFVASVVVCVGAATGLVQQAVLRRFLSRVRWWWAATVAGSYLAALIGFASWTIVSPKGVAGESDPLSWSARLLASLVGGLIIGGGQWLVLRRLVLQAGWWVPASGLGWGLGLPLAQWTLDLLSYGADATPTTIAVSGLALGGAAGLITGGTLTWLLRAPIWRITRHALALVAIAAFFVYGRIQSESGGQTSAVVIEYAVAREDASIVWSPDGVRLALVDVEGTVRVWERSDRESFFFKLSHAAPIAWSRDGRWIAASVLEQSSVITKVYDAVTGKEHHSLSAPRRGLSNPPTWSPDGRYLAIGTRDGLELWNVATWAREEVVRPEWGEWVYLDVRWSPDGTRLAIMEAKDTVLVWEVSHAKGPPRRMGSAFDVSWGPDGTLLAVAASSAVKILRLTDPPETIKILDLKIPGNIAYGITWSPGGERLAVDLGKQIRVWHTATWVEEERLDAQTFAGGAPTVWSPNGKDLAYPFGNTVHVWNASTKKARVLRGHKSEVFGIAWSPDGQFLATASEDGTVRIWAF